MIAPLGAHDGRRHLIGPILQGDGEMLGIDDKKVRPVELAQPVGLLAHFLVQLAALLLEARLPFQLLRLARDVPPAHPHLLAEFAAGDDLVQHHEGEGRAEKRQHQPRCRAPHGPAQRCGIAHAVGKAAHGPVD